MVDLLLVGGTIPFERYEITIEIGGSVKGFRDLGRSDYIVG